MKLQQLFEGIKKQTEFDEDVQYVAKIILRDCKPYLEKINYFLHSNYLYRGFINIENPYTSFSLARKTSRLNDRKPTSTKIDLHNRINDSFNKQFGHPYRNSVFVSGDLEEAIEYGETFAVFPIGDFEFLWSPKVLDLYDFSFDLQRFNKEKIHTEDDVGALMDKNELGYTNTNLTQAIASNNEIMLWVKHYYILPADKNKLNSLNNIIVNRGVDI